MLLKNKLWGLCGLAILFNFLLTYGTLLYQQPFNVDGIVYLNTATTYLSQGFHAATKIYAWPFYSISLALLSQVTHLSLINAAWLMNALLTSLLTIFFILLIKECGGSIKAQYWGLLIILIYPYLNHDRYNILRDFGYYTFFLVSLWCYIKFITFQNWRYAMLWQCAIWIAIGFRLEGGVILCFAPLAVFFAREDSWRIRFLNFIKLNILNILLLVMTLFICQSFWHYGRIPDLMLQVKPEQVLGTFQQKITVIQQQVFDVFGKNNAALFLFGGLVALFVKAIIDTLGLFYVVLAGYAIAIKDISINPRARLAIIGYAIIVLMTLVGFLSQQLFLSSRYVVPLALLAMLWIPFGMIKLWEKNKPVIKMLIGIFLIITIVDCIVFFGPSKTYLIKAGEWVAQNTSDQALFYTNDPQLYYYAHRNGLVYPSDFPDQQWWSRLQHLDVDHFQYYAIAIRHDDKQPTLAQVTKLLGSAPIATFSNGREDMAYIFAHKP